MVFDNVDTHSSHLPSYKKKKRKTNRSSRKNKRQHVIAKSGWGCSLCDLRRSIGGTGEAGVDGAYTGTGPDDTVAEVLGNGVSFGNIRKSLCVSIVVILLTTFLVRHCTDIITQWITEPEKRLERGQQRMTATTHQPLHMASSQSLCWGIAPIQQGLKFGGTRFFAFLVSQSFQHSLFSIIQFFLGGYLH